MKKRGIILLAVGLAAWAYTFYVFGEIQKSPFGYEFGSVAFPIPLHLRVMGIFSLLGTLVGCLMTSLDLARRLKTR